MNGASTKSSGKSPGDWHPILNARRPKHGTKYNEKTKAASRLLRRLSKHLGSEPGKLPVVEKQFAPHERPNLHLAIEEMLSGAGRQAELIGVVAHQEHDTPSLARLSNQASAKYFDEGPVEYVDAPLPGSRHLACVKNGLYLVREKEGPLALFVKFSRYAYPPTIQVEAMAADREQAERFLRQLQRLTNHGKAFRGQVLSRLCPFLAE